MIPENKKKNRCLFSNFGFYLFLISIYLIVSNLFAQTLYFIHSGPTEISRGYHVPFETRIYELDESNKELRQIWSLGKDKEAKKIAVYPSSGIAMISGDRDKVNELFIFDMSDISDKSITKIDKGARISNFWCFSDSDNINNIAIDFVGTNSKGARQKTREFYSTTGEKISNSKGAIDFFGDIRLCGGRPIGCNESDLIHFPTLPQGKTKAAGIDYEFIAAPIPDSMSRIGSSKGWSLIANEPQFYALSSILDRNGLTQGEILIYNRLGDKWSSFLIKGATTSLRLVNNWLTGEVKQMNPESDYEDPRQPKSGDIFTGEVVLINPLEGNYFTVDLGVGCSVLWIENDIVYYKTVTHTEAYIYKARIENNKFVEAELLSDDPVVRYFRWAFRGETRE